MSETVLSKKIFMLPMVVAVTGHRDLVPDQVPAISDRVKQLLLQLQKDYPYRRLTVMSPLAEGADLLVAEVAAELDIDLWVPLPKPRTEYLKDFGTPETIGKFELLCRKASCVFELESQCPPAPDGIDPESWENAYPYAQMGTFLSAHCHILLAIWDGLPSNKLGGTAQVVRFHHDDVMEGFTSTTIEAQQMMIDDESDLVFHIQCARKSHKVVSKSGADANKVTSTEEIDWCWYTKDRDNPRSKELPRQHELIFKRSSEFSEDAQEFAERIEEEKYSLIEQEGDSRLPIGVEEIDRHFCIADWLAIYYQRKTLRTLVVSHWMAFMMGLMFILYSDLETWRYFLMAFLGFFAVAVGVQFLAKRGSWQRKYLDYRTLAEGLRVQFYWAVAGVRNENKWKFTHDTYLQSQNPEFGWIRNVMRVAGFLCDAHPNSNPEGVDFTVAEWVGSANSGQLGYYQRKGQERIKRHQLTEMLGNISLTISVVSVLLFVIFGPLLTDFVQITMTVVMGSALMLYAVREGYNYAVGTKELIKQYEFMFRIFENAHQRLRRSDSVDEKRTILFALGQSALDEHSDWTLMHRERALDEKEIWHMIS